jgi:hypothetical protein
MSDPLLEAVAALGDTTVAAETVALSVDGLPETPGEAQFIAYSGVLALLADVGMERDPDGLRLDDAAATVRSIEPVLHFELFEMTRDTERLELIARTRERDIELTTDWMIPRLRRDIETYRVRIDALQRAIEDAS